MNKRSVFPVLRFQHILLLKQFRLSLWVGGRQTQYSACGKPMRQKCRFIGMMRAVCPGSFDPLHNGHVEVIARASSLFDEVIVAVSKNPSKKPRFSLEERMEMARETLTLLRGITVEPMGEGLLAEFCRDHGAGVIVKGLRSAVDYNYEVPMAAMNRQLTGVETVFLAGDSHYTHLSSTLLKEVASLGGDISDYVPRAVYRGLNGTQ